MDHILGHHDALSLLQHSLSSGRLHHAWIFHGPAGVGKHTVALAFASILLDPDSAPDLSGKWRANPDGQCARLIAADTHPDLHLVNKELARHSRDSQIRDRKLTTIPVEVVREFLVEPAARSSQLSHNAPARKVFIVDEAELMAREAQNVLLKTLEEPPSGTVIILCTADENRLLPTIRSRCRRVAFAPLSDEDFSRWLKARPEFTSLDTHARQLLIQLCDGSPGLAQRLLDYDLLAWRADLESRLDAMETGRLPADFPARLASLIDEFAGEWVKRNKGAGKEAANRAGARLMMHWLSRHADRRMRESLQREDADVAHAWADRIDQLREAESRLNANINMTLVFEGLVSAWAQ